MSEVERHAAPTPLRIGSSKAAFITLVTNHVIRAVSTITRSPTANCAGRLPYAAATHEARLVRFQRDALPCSKAWVHLPSLKIWGNK
jgi:hypothetical protein